ncbi:MAG TPA: ElyC/SanA/YdcF family protein [Candidatus Paceibacterota bacterium]
MRFLQLARLPILLSAFALVLVLAVPIAMRLSMQSYMYTNVLDVPEAQAALVLGASVVRGKPSPILEERAAVAVELYSAGKVAKILVTGDNGALTHDEVTPVRKYLLDMGVPAGDIFLDHAGFDTYSSMYRARDVFLADSLIIVTQDFHLPRALYLARHLGITAYGVAPVSMTTAPRNYAREIPASIKAVLNLALKREPKYLGDTIPLDTSDGSTTWY